MMNKIILILSICFWSFSGLASKVKQVLYEVPYGNHERQVFDIWMPKSKITTPLVIYIHGGGFSQGSKNEVRGHSVIQKYLENGIAFASINYRFLKHAPIQTIMREDIAGFVQFIRRNAKKFNIDSKLIMSHGVSAGGSASLWLATHDDIALTESADPTKRESSRIFAASHLYSQVSYDYIDWYDYFDPKNVDRFVGSQVWSRYHLNSKEELFSEKGMAIRADVDMYENLSSDDSPTLFWNYNEPIEGDTADQFVHSALHAKLLYERASQVGIDAEIVLKGDYRFGTDHMIGSFNFFMKKLRNSSKR